MSTCRSQDSGSYDASSKGNSSHDQGPPGLDPGGDIQVSGSQATIVNVNDNSLQSNWEEVVEKFDDMNLREKLLRGIYAYG